VSQQPPEGEQRDPVVHDAHHRGEGEQATNDVPALFQKFKSQCRQQIREQYGKATNYLREIRWRRVLRANRVIATATVAYAIVSYFQLAAINQQIQLAKEANESTKTALAVSQRARVVVASVEREKPFTAGEVPRIALILTNTGSSTALNVRAFANYAVQAIEPEPVPVSMCIVAGSQSAIGAGGSYRAHGAAWRNLLGMEADQINTASPAFSFFVQGSATYGDEFEPLRELTYCWRWNQNLESFEQCSSGNYAP
jgi:hypothetical protein